MPFPPVRYCILCEDVRPEYGNKLTILGFYGIAPDVDIHLTQRGLPVRLYFLLGFGTGDGTYTTIAQILGPDGTSLVGDLTTSLRFDSNTAQHVTGLGILAMPVQTPGKHTFQLLFNEDIVYSTTFTLSVQEPKEERQIPVPPPV